MNNPILLAVELSNGSFLSCRLLHPDRHTRTHLNRWYVKMHEAIFLIQLGDLHYIHGKQASALHRDWGEDWIEHQPRISPSMNHLKALSRSLKINTLYINQGYINKSYVNQSNEWVVDTIS